MEMAEFDWPLDKPRAVVQLVHGMAEHMGRYDRLARALNAAGYAAAGRDHRGHGADAQRPGYFADQAGWDCLVEDAHALTLRLKARYPGVPFILLGHSMGSFVCREYALRYGAELDGLVLCGTGAYGRGLCAAGRALAACAPRKRPAKLVDKIAFSANNKPFAPARTPFDWLSRDEAEVDRYIADPLCGFVFTGEAFFDFFGGLARLTKASRLSALPSALPVYFIAGECDPVGQMGAGVRKTAARFRAAGVRDVEMRLYPGARHELFNETNRDEVTRELIDWLNRHTAAEA